MHHSYNYYGERSFHISDIVSQNRFFSANMKLPFNGLIYYLLCFTGLGKGRKFNQTKGGSRRASTKSRDSLKLRRKR